MNFITKVSIFYPNSFLEEFIQDTAWLMVLDAMILTSHKNQQVQAYLPGSKDTVISKAVPSGRDSTIALRWSWSLRFPQMWGTREHNLWELGTAFALSPQKNPDFTPSIHSPLPHLNIAVKSKLIVLSIYRISAVEVTNLSLPIFVSPLFLNIFFLKETK